MNTLPTVSVCIANYNGMAVIDDCIASVLAQDCAFPVEIIVHDDASTDGSAQYIRTAYPQLVLIESQNNVGFCIANNRMVQAAEGEYLLLLNNDAELYPDALSSLHKAARDIGRPAILSLPQYNHETGELLDIGSLVDPFFNPVPNRNPERGEVAMVMGACLWIPTPLWQELGGFPEWFGSVAEDLYLCCRARLAGYSVRALGISGYRHRVGGSFGGGKVQQGRLITTRRRRALSERNKSFVMVVTCPSPYSWILIPLHLLVLGMEGFALSGAMRSFRVWREIYTPVFQALMTQYALLMELRQRVQARRRIKANAFFSVFTWQLYKLRMLRSHGFPEIR